MRCPTPRFALSRLALLFATTLALAVPTAAATPPPPDWRDFVRLGHHLYCGGGHGRYVALTFDDGPGPYTERLVSVFRRAHAHATFFIVGSRVHWWRQSVRDELRNGALGNHTWSHPRLSELNARQIRTQITRTQRELGALGTYAFIFRPPYEVSTPGVDRVVRTLGLLDVRWSVDSLDSRVGASLSATAARVVAGLKPGAIVLMHDAHPWTPDLAAIAVRAARARHLRMVTVPELLAFDPPRRSQLRREGYCP